MSARLRRFRRRDDTVVASLAVEEVTVLRSIPRDLEPLLDAGPGPQDPAYARLFPTAYLDPTEESAEREWQELVHPDLLRLRLEALRRVTDTLDRGEARKGRVEVELGPDEVEAWLGVLNDARLVLGVRLGITEDLDDAGGPPSGPDAPAYEVYGLLTYLQGELVETLLGE